MKEYSKLFNRWSMKGFTLDYINTLSNFLSVIYSYSSPSTSPSLWVLVRSKMLAVVVGGLLIFKHTHYITYNQSIINSSYDQLQRSTLNSPIDITTITYFNHPNGSNSNKTLFLIDIVTLVGPAAVSTDNIVHVVITYDDTFIPSLIKLYKENNLGGLYSSISVNSKGVYKVYDYSQTFSLLFLKEALRYELNITSHILFVSLKSIMETSFDEYLFEKSILDFGSYVANQLVKTFNKKNGYMKEAETNNLWYWKQNHYEETMLPSFIEGPLEFLILKIAIILKAITVFSIISVFACISLHMGSVSIVAPYIVLIKFKNWICGKRYSLPTLYEQFPWIGALGTYLLRKGKSDKYVLWGFIGLFAFSLVFFVTGYYVWREMHTTPYYSNYSSIYLFYILILELTLLIFCRTRISAKYLPKILTIINVLYLCYLYSYFYVFSKLVFFVLAFSSISVICFFIVYYEIPAIAWGNTDKFKPSLQNPRQIYVSIPLMNFSFGFDLWTIFYPPAFRSEFKESEQSHITNQIELMRYDFSIGDEERFSIAQDELLMQEINRAGYEMT